MGSLVLLSAMGFVGFDLDREKRRRRYITKRNNIIIVMIKKSMKQY